MVAIVQLSPSSFIHVYLAVASILEAVMRSAGASLTLAVSMSATPVAMPSASPSSSRTRPQPSPAVVPIQTFLAPKSA